jgi:integrase
MQLTDIGIKRLKPSGSATGEKYSDGRGLYLHVKPGGKYWRLNYSFGGKAKTLALGVYPDVPLVLARERRDAARALLVQGMDPAVAKIKDKLSQAAQAANSFEAVALDWLEKSRAERNEVTQARILRWLELDVFGPLGKLSMADIGPRDVLAVLRSMEARNSFSQARSVKGSIGQIFRFAVASGLAERDVTADLKGALVTRSKSNYSALTEPDSVGAMLRAMDDYASPMTRSAMQLSALFFCRSQEVRAMEWAEIDLDAALWCIPAAKMKMKRDHMVPICTQALQILRTLQGLTGRERYVFKSAVASSGHLSKNTMNKALRSMGITGDMHTHHGFRAMARTLMDEVMEVRADLLEHQLAHKVPGVLGPAYNRSKYLDQRRVMMQDYADYLDRLRRGADVIALPLKAA